MAQDSFGICPTESRVFLPQNQHPSWRAGWGWGWWEEAEGEQDLSSLIHLLIHSFHTMLKMCALKSGSSGFKF